MGCLLTLTASNLYTCLVATARYQKLASNISSDHYLLYLFFDQTEFDEDHILSIFKLYFIRTDFSVSVSNFVSISLRTCWWTTRWRSLLPTCMRPSAPHRSCRNNQPSNRRTRRGNEEEEGLKHKSDLSPGLFVPPSFLWDTFLLQILQTFHSVMVRIHRRNVHDKAGQGAPVFPLWTEPLWITVLVEEDETRTEFVVTAEPVVNSRTTASWELESYLTR